MQPIAYCWTLFSFMDQIDNLQQILALIVAGREISYFLIALLGVYICPQYLLTNIYAGWENDNGTTLNDRFWGLFTYGFSPEKFILMCIVSKVKFESPHYCAVKILFCLFFVILLLCDTCAFMVLVVGVMRHCLPIPFAISYGCTGMAALWMYCISCL